MRVMVIVKANAESEAGRMPNEAELTEMGKFNAELVKAGILLAADGLHSSAQGKRVRFGGDGARTVIDGPFAETKELVSGYWVWQVKSMEEAVEWLKRAPFKLTEVEIRRVHDMADFAESDPTGKIRASEAALRKQVEAQRH